MGTTKNNFPTMKPIKNQNHVNWVQNGNKWWGTTTLKEENSRILLHNCVNFWGPTSNLQNTKQCQFKIWWKFVYQNIAEYIYIYKQWVMSSKTGSVTKWTHICNSVKCMYVGAEY